VRDIAANINKTFDEFPRLFWIVVLTRFIDALGGTITFPFFSLYVTQKFGVGMTQAGILLGLNSFFALAGMTSSGVERSSCSDWYSVPGAVSRWV
jgi:hypothetical protein